MISFELSEEQVALKEMARDFAQKELIPVAPKHDQGHDFPWDVMQKAFEAGFLTSSIPAEYGGGGLNALDTVIISEELAAGCAGLFTSIMANSLALYPIISFGTEEQKQKFLTPFARKLTFASFCLTEREAGSDAGRVTTEAKRDGSDYILNGSKCFITNGGVAKLHVVFANTSKNRGTRGMTAFLVPSNLEGVNIGKTEDKMGHRASNTAELFFDNVRVPEENRLGKEGMGFAVAIRTLDKARPSVGAAGVGVARASLQNALEYSKTRVQFGKPIAAFQYTGFKLSEMATEVTASRLLVWQSAWLLDSGVKSSREAAMAKYYATDTAMRNSIEAVQILGGYGYMKDYPVEKLMRDAKLLQIYEGTNEVQRLVISRELVKRGIGY